ncbi:MAG: hypothetical protein JJU11_17735 [Candidatus Sumerlaeia bacterium]|nr:hypothetical protein [Candidatus Sumerlaeia bacterium]
MYRHCWLLALVLLFPGCALFGGGSGAREYIPTQERTFNVVERLEGAWRGREIVLRRDQRHDTVRVLAADFYQSTELAVPNPGDYRIMVAFQLASDKTRDDYRAFKELHLSWVSTNGGRSHATVWTERSEHWPYDGFDEMIVRSMEDFETIREGNRVINEARADLLRGRQFVALIRERRD